MKIFLSWSGPRSRSLATALREWIPLVLHYTEPWLSDKDISAGERWAAEVGKELAESHFGIICLTKDNLSAPWVLFEAGALSKALTESSVCPYLLDLDFSEVSGPLSQFQAKKTDKKSTYELLEAINNKSSKPIDTPKLGQLFNALWPTFESKFQEIPEYQGEKQPVRQTDDILEEIITTLRANERRFRSIEREIALTRRTVSRSISSSSVSFRSKDIALKVELTIDTPRYPKSSFLNIAVDPSTNLPELVAGVTNVDMEDYEQSWDFYYPRNEKFLSRDEAVNIYDFLKQQDDTEPVIQIIGTIPF